MATNRLIQKLFRFDESGVGEDSVTASDRRQVERFRVLAVGTSQTVTIAAGNSVVFQYDAATAGEVAMSVKLAAADSQGVIGIALEAGVSTTDGSDEVTAAPFIDVAISGIVEAKVKGENAAGNSAIAAGEYLAASDDPGVFYKHTPGTDHPVAICVNIVNSAAAAANVPVIMLSQF